MIGLDQENQKESLKNENNSLAEYESIQSIFENVNRNYVQGAI